MKYSPEVRRSTAALIAHKRLMTELAAKIEVEDKIAALRSVVSEKREEAHLVLASELLCLKTLTDLSWALLADALGDVCHHTILFRLAKRATYVNSKRYALLTEAIDTLRIKRGLPAVQWVEWKDWQSLCGSSK